MVMLTDSIKKEGKVSEQIRKRFFYGRTFKDIRSWLKENGLDSHMPIELVSTEVALVTPEGILMQIRKSDKNQLGLLGGVVNDSETPEEGALRELAEETGIELCSDDLEFVGINKHFHQYDNGDKAIFKSYRYIVRMDYVPEIRTDEESEGTILVTKTILSHQQNFVREILSSFK